MTSVRFLLTLSIALPVLSMSPEQAHSADLVINGGFEVPLVTGSSGYNYRLGTEITGWTVIAPAGNSGTPQFVASYSPVAEGFQGVQLDDPGEGISQLLATVPGQPYEMQFLLSAYVGPTATMAVRIDGVDTFFNGTSASYALHVLGFVATTSTTTISFLNAGPSFTYPHLDAVSVVAVPEPSAVTMLLAGLCMLWHTVKRRNPRG